ncbi:C40 family peptidase [Halobacillus sp. ACCC02827]|uniref:C40 family peptidase n=1 Tax=Halobacillus sp. ACCC02827 TaxID=3052090 RepID=UPI002570AA16|nr:C40 family peptidase [Halobacillus sp. ACCC02827]WJE17122.1 C40 family peptidase [Halobacillus sp. ACCC02827]
MNQQERIWIVSAPVATVWTSPESPRPIDEQGLERTFSVKKWLEELDDPAKHAMCDDNLVQSQLLYGERVLVDEVEGDWAKVVIPSQPSSKDARGYPGYVPYRQLTEVPEADWKGVDLVVVHAKATILYDEKKQPLFEISFLTELPFLYEEDSFIRVRLADGEGYVSREDARSKPKDIREGSGASIIKTAEAFKGLPYFWGGMSAFGYDCSGFAYNMHKAHGHVIPRDASDQALHGIDIPLDRVEPGDLLFFAYEEGKGRIHHVGFYYGHGKMLHSPNIGKAIEIIDLQGSDYEKEWCRVRRYGTEEGAS